VSLCPNGSDEDPKIVVKVSIFLVHILLDSISSSIR